MSRRPNQHTLRSHNRGICFRCKLYIFSKIKLKIFLKFQEHDWFLRRLIDLISDGRTNDKLKQTVVPSIRYRLYREVNNFFRLETITVQNHKCTKQNL